MWRWLAAFLAHWLASSTVATNGQPSACSTNSTVAPNVIIEPPVEWALETKARLRQKYRLLGEDWAFPGCCSGLQPSCVQLVLPHQEFPISQDWRLANCRRRPPRSMWSRASFTLSCPIQVPPRPSVPRAIPCSPSPPVRASLPVMSASRLARLSADHRRRMRTIRR